jgi:mono/diheme cytochrome c family protein
LKLASLASPGFGLLAVLALVGVGCKCGGSEAPSVAGAGDEAPDVAAGRRMYREGIRPSGEPLTATVTGDVPFLGTQFTCQSCHGRSGMGAAEGATIVPAITGPLLYAPSEQAKRPAYDPESLARALREGLDPTGRSFQPLMPRYRISDDEVRSLAAYLASLSPGSAPGVDDKVIRLATVVTDDVSSDVRDDVLAVLRTYVDDKNRQTRGESKRPDRGTTPASRLPTLFREWVVDVWTLTGPSEGWPAQLEERYRSGPVFALLSGLGTGSWGPIGRFCESHEIPCLFPSTDLPDAEEGDFYTLHFSRGLELEADLIASHIAAQPVGNVIQVFCGATPARAAAALRSTLMQKGVAVEDLEFACEEPLPVAGLASRMAKVPGSAAVLWLRHEQLAGLERPLPPGRSYFSSTLLDRDLDGPLLSAPGPVFVAHPYRLPGESDPGLRRFTAWARTRGIELRHPRLQAEAFFACLAANDGLTHIERYFVRDYVLDMLDHAQGMALYLPIHPRATLGPGQRFLTKGGYVLPVVDGQLDTKDAAWILP